ncbi:FIG137887: membrane protein related to purine degradation [hydrothermal vent metagenome]|uniref:FIG137887: membrane protein related to purine degradation n=1 Tax=hydrothermal vent metagenome TaxID=652676 RepID=A0A3B0SYK6_9ZZZZ
MEIDLLPWMSLAVRWLHLIAGIAWIGSSFYFIWLDNSLTQEPDETEDGVAGGLWAVHGGGFYHKKKYLLAPKAMPEHLHWFKWEAYVTWLSGMGLLLLIYYWQADLYLIDTAKMQLSQIAATGLGLGVLALGWLFYDGLCRLAVQKSNLLSGVLWFGFLLFSAYALTRIFSDRGAFLHVGAMIGTVMVGNVFLVIIPNQKIVVASMLAGEKPDPKLGKIAKQRSLHNNYMTLPVLLIMVSTHYPALFGHPLNWLLLALLSLSGILIRHFFNLRHKNKVLYPVLLSGMALFVATMVLAAVTSGTRKTSQVTVAFSQVQQIVDKHCSMCHSAAPTHEAFFEPPAGVMFDSRQQIEKFAPGILDQVVVGKIMPLGNETNMSEEERQILASWIAQNELAK